MPPIVTDLGWHAFAAQAALGMLRTLHARASLRDESMPPEVFGLAAPTTKPPHPYNRQNPRPSAFQWVYYIKDGLPGSQPWPTDLPHSPSAPGDGPRPVKPSLFLLAALIVSSAASARGDMYTFVLSNDGQYAVEPEIAADAFKCARGGSHCACTLQHEPGGEPGAGCSRGVVGRM